MKLHPEAKSQRSWLQWAILFSLLLALILLPFVLWGSQLEQWATATLRSPGPERSLWIGGFVAALLATDVFLPVPSSIVSTAGGALLGVAAGTFWSFLGMTASCVFGYLFARSVGPLLTRRFLSEAQQAELSRTLARYGDGILAVARPLPVMAEASVLVAGLSAMPLPRFLLITSASNLVISLAYAAAGAYALRWNVLPFALVILILIPLLTSFVFKRL